MLITKFVLIFFLIIINSFAIAAGKVVTGSLPAVVLFYKYPEVLFNNREMSNVKRELFPDRLITLKDAANNVEQTR